MLSYFAQAEAARKFPEISAPNVQEIQLNIIKATSKGCKEISQASAGSSYSPVRVERARLSK